MLRNKTKIYIINTHTPTNNKLDFQIQIKKKDLDVHVRENTI